MCQHISLLIPSKKEETRSYSTLSISISYASVRCVVDSDT